MNQLMNKTIREIAVEIPASTRIFEEFKIDYCCGGGRSFNDACQHAGIAPETVNRKIAAALKLSESGTELPQTENLTQLIDYILEKHHVFTKAELTRLEPLMEKVCRKHGEHHPELFKLQNSFIALYYDLMPHMQKEEMVLFPFIKNLELASENRLSSQRPHFGTVKNPVRMMMVEHDTDGKILRQMREISRGYLVPENACPSFRALYFGLEELEKDLHRHIHLENNILFPRAVELEEQVLGGN